MTRRTMLLWFIPVLTLLIVGTAQAQPFFGLGEDAGKMVVRLVDESQLFVEDIGNGKPEARVIGRVERTEEGAKLRAQMDELGLDVGVEYVFKPGRAEINGRVRDITGKDRAVIVKFALPLDATGWTWWDDIRTSRPIRDNAAYHNYTGHGQGGKHSVYPFSCISKDVSLCIGIPPATPIVHRISYDTDKKRYEIAFDLGLSPETQKFPSSAEFSLIVFDAGAEWGFRAAAAKYYKIYSDSFWCRTKRQGIWMPFTKISQVERAEDFGFGFQEGASDVAYDDAHNILSFVYVEPWSLRFYLPPDVKEMPSPEKALEHPLVKEKQANLIAIAKSCGIHTKDGKYSTGMYTADWARGKTVYDFLVSADPEIPGEVTKAKVMDEAIFGRFDKEKEQGNQLDGVYFDGFGEWRGPNENYRKELWRPSDYPLTFSWETKKPVQLTCFTVYEYVRHIAKKLKPKMQFLMANGFAYGFSFTAHDLDVVGNEIHWMKQTGADDAFLDLRRTMAYQKPYLPLNNEDFTVFKDREVEKYFTKCLYYGFLPSMFSPGASGHDNYWNTPEFHNRERHLFRKYIPIIIRVAEAGWEPETYAWSSDPAVRVERFGRGLERNVHITVYNDSDAEKDFDVKVDRSALGIDPRDAMAYDLVSGRELDARDDWGRWRVRGHLPPRGVAAIWPTSRDLAAGYHVACAMAKIDISCSRIDNSKLADAEKKALSNKLGEIARQLRMSPFSDKGVAGQIVEVRRLCLDDAIKMPGIKMDCQDVNQALSKAEMLLSGVHLEIGGDACAPAGRTGRVVLRVANNADCELNDIKVTLVAQEGDRVQPLGSATAPSIAAKSVREFPMDIAIPRTARLGGYMPLMGRLIADREAQPLVLCTRSSVIVSPLCDVRVERCEDEPKFVVTIRNNARGTISGAIRPKPTSGWSVQPGEAKVAVDGSGLGRYDFAFIPPKDAKTGMFKSVWEISIDGMPGPSRGEASFSFAPPEKNLLKNAGFEEDKTGWDPYEKGFSVVGGRKGGRGLQCENRYPVEASGAVQQVAVKQTKATPLLLSAWSKAEEVSGGKNKDYSIYVDIKYTDGTPLYGQTIEFGPGTHGWEYAECLIEPQKPVESVSVYALFRRHSGKVWFDDIRICGVGD